MTVALCYGNRPQLIKAARLARVLGERWELLTVDACEPGDGARHDALRRELGMAPPAAALDGVVPATASSTADVLAGATALFAREGPRAVVVIGDSGAALGCALAASRLRIPLVHVEAGVRARDAMLTADTARCVIDRTSDVLCAPSRTAATRLRAEGVRGEVLYTGDVARDALRVNVARAVEPAAIPGWPLAHGEPFFLAALRDVDAGDHPEQLPAVLRALARSPFPVVLTAPASATRRLASLAGPAPAGRVHVLPPLGYLEMLGCVRAASGLVTDSGGAQREAYWLGTPCVTLRRETEWTETVMLGANALVPAGDAEARLPARLQQLAFGARRTDWARGAYGDGRAAERIRDALEACIGVTADAA